MLNFFHKKDNVSYILQGFDKTPSKLPDGLPWALSFDREILQKFFDDSIEDFIEPHAEKDLSFTENLMLKRKEMMKIGEMKDFENLLSPDDLSVDVGEQTVTYESLSAHNDEPLLKTPNTHSFVLPDKEVLKAEEEFNRSLEKLRAQKGTGLLTFKKTLNSILETTDLWALSKVNKIYFVKLKGAYVSTIPFIISHTGFENTDIYVDILSRFLAVYLQAYPWRMENFKELQKFYIRLNDIKVGTTPDLKYVQDVLCPKLYAVADKDSVNYSNIEITLEPNKITTVMETADMDKRIQWTEAQETDWSFPEVDVTTTPKPENINLIYVNYKWKSEAYLMISLFTEFFTQTLLNYARKDIHRNMFEKNMIDLIESHICPTKEKIKGLVLHYFTYMGRRESFVNLFVEVIHTILYSPEGTVKEEFDVDVRKIIEILNQYVQAE